MKFLILTQYYPPEVGAPQVRLQAMARELAARGHQVEVVTAIPNHPLGRYFPGYKSRMYFWEVSQGIKIHRTWIYPAIGAGLKRIFNYLSFTLSSFWGMMKAGRPDFVWVESPPLFLGWTAMAYSRFRRVPFIFNIADLWPDSIIELGLMGNGLVARMLYMTERAIYNRAKYVIAVTQGIRDRLIDSKGLPARKILYLPNGVDTEMFRPSPFDMPLAADLGLAGKDIILYSGTLGFAQGLGSVLEAFQIIRDSHRQITLLMVGSGSERKKLQQMAQERSLDNVRFLDPVPPEMINKYLSISLAGLVCLKDLELFRGARPSKMFPIMSCGKPVIFCGRGEGARLVHDSKGGVVVPPEDPEALAAAIADLAGDRETSKQMGLNGRDYALKYLSWERMVGEWLSQLESRQKDGEHE
ncbi:MAG: glycosyltransferase family 4 protein [Candidatus Edwardsbacteria bacterium]|nr:glycosyltransferase family 4 protein [Candidatus Edwardsbacteria bacterium]